MSARLYVGNLSWNTTEAELADFVAAHADVVETRIPTDRDTGRPRGFGFVTIETDDLQGVINALNGQQLDGRSLRVNEAEERPQRGYSNSRSRY